MSIFTRTMNDGRSLPAIGLGTYKLNGSGGVDAVATAIDAGYRLLDTALNYENEKEVGDGIRRSGIDRSELVVTTKLPGRFHGREEARVGFTESLGNLGLEYVDLFLIHWPLPRVNKFVDTWRTMIDLQAEGLIRSIGVSNFTPEMLTRLQDETGVVPAVNQVELHPRFPQIELQDYHRAHGIVTESWSPIGNQSELTGDPAIIDIAAAHGKTPTQAVLRWHVQLGAVPIPKSANPQRQRENIDIFDFELSDAEVARISALAAGRLWGGDPETNEEF